MWTDSMRLKCTPSLGLQDPQATEQGHPHPCCKGQEAGLHRTTHPALRQHLQYLRTLPTGSPKDKASGGKPHCRRQERGFYQKRLKKKTHKIMLKIQNLSLLQGPTREQCQRLPRTQAGKEKPSSLRLKVTGKPNVSRGKKRPL